MYATKDAPMNDIKNAANDVKDELSGAANQAGRKVRSFMNSASNEISHVSDSVTKQVQNNPVQSSLIALGVGFVLGSLLRR